MKTAGEFEAGAWIEDEFGAFAIGARGGEEEDAFHAGR